MNEHLERQMIFWNGHADSIKGQYLVLEIEKAAEQNKIIHIDLLIQQDIDVHGKSESILWALWLSAVLYSSESDCIALPVLRI